MEQHALKSAKSTEKVRVIACGMIAREVLAVNAQLGRDHIDLKCVDANFHHHPERIAPAVERAILQARQEGYENIFIGYADCGTGGALDRVCKDHGVERIEGPHCFSFYVGNAAFEAESDAMMTTFFITDFLARHFEAFLMQARWASTAFQNCATPISAIMNARSISPRPMIRSLSKRPGMPPTGWACPMSGA
jgi:hypothetical protein